MRPKFCEGELIQVKADKSLMVIDKEVKEGEGYTFFAVFPGLGNLKNPQTKAFKEREICLAPKKDYKKIECLCSLLDDEENKFVAAASPFSIEEVPLTGKTLDAFLAYLCRIVFFNEFSKGLSADDAFLAFSVRIIDKLSKLVGRASSVKQLYYSHLIQEALAKPKDEADWASIRTLFEKAANSGDGSAYVSLGVFYLRGRFSGQREEEKALECFSKAIEGGCEDGLLARGVLELDKNSKCYDEEKAYRDLSLAGMNGDGFALYRIARMIFEGGKGENDAYAFSLLKRAYERDISDFLDGDFSLHTPEQAYLLSKMYKEGRGVKADQKISLYYFLVASASLKFRNDRPLFLVEETNAELEASLKSELNSYPPELLQAFSQEVILNEERGLIDLPLRDSDLFLVDNIEQDISQKLTKIVVTFLNNAVPYLDSKMEAHLSDKAVIRLYGPSKISGLSTRFYLGVEFALYIQEGLGKIALDFSDEGDYGTFFTQADRLTASFQEWKGSLRPLSSNPYFETSVLGEEAGSAGAAGAAGSTKE